LRIRLPFQADRITTPPRFDQRVVAGLDAEPFAAAEHMIVRIAAARQPDPAFQHGQQPGRSAEAARPIARDVQHPGFEGGRFVVRFHHQSCCPGVPIVLDFSLSVQ
jgi:hypothetical protein